MNEFMKFSNSQAKQIQIIPYTGTSQSNYCNSEIEKYLKDIHWKRGASSLWE